MKTLEIVHPAAMSMVDIAKSQDSEVRLSFWHYVTGNRPAFLCLLGAHVSGTRAVSAPPLHMHAISSSCSSKAVGPVLETL